jgi:hypothetical protein
VVEGRAKEGRQGVLLLCRLPTLPSISSSLPRNKQSELVAWLSAVERVSDPATPSFPLGASLPRVYISTRACLRGEIYEDRLSRVPKEGYRLNLVVGCGKSHRAVIAKRTGRADASRSKQVATKNGRDKSSS